MNPVLQIFGLLLSAAAALVGSLVLYNLRLLNKRLDQTDHRLELVENRQGQLADRKIDCQRDFVSSEQWIRSESYTRSKLDGIAASVNILAGSLKIVEQLPQICGQIARDIIKEMKAGT